jgi:SAM-dependent methyltransferase
MSEFRYQTHNWLIHKLMWEHLSMVIPRYARGVMLDVGCGQRPYQQLSSSHVTAQFGVDYPVDDAVEPAVDVQGDALALPIASESVDTVLYTELLEHLPLPLDAMRELSRVLKPGGHVILTTPLFWHIHEEPRDYYRFTRYGLEFLLNASGFEVVQTSELTGFWATFVQLWCYTVQTRSIRKLIAPLVWLSQRVAYWVNKHSRNRRFNCLTIVVGRKRDLEQ